MNEISGTEGKILANAGKLFAERGYFGTSMCDIAGKVGIGKSALYYYFDSKEDLCKKLMRKNLSVLKKDLGQAVKKDATPFQIILVLLNFRIKHPEISLLTSLTGGGGSGKEPIIQYIAKKRMSILKLIGEQIEKIDITRKIDRKYRNVFSASLLGFIFGPFVPKKMNSEDLAKQLTRYSLTVK